MSEIKHSPLPWKMVEHNWSDRSIYSASEPLPVCGNYIPHDDITIEQQEAYELKAHANLEFIVEASNNYYRLKEQNEKLLNLITQAEAWLSLNTHPDIEEIAKFKNSLSEAIKS